MNDDDDNDMLTLPWSDMQEWALKDNISKYTITIPTKNVNVNNNDNNNYSFILWNTMINEVTELHGYSISYLSTKLKYINTNTDTNMNQNMDMDMNMASVPYMTNYEFVTNGGIKGEVYNKEGIADGSIIITNPLMNVRNTLPNGYVQTISNNDNDTIGIIYELGYALSNNNGKQQQQQQYSSMMLQSLSNVNNNIMTTATTNANTENNDIFDLVKNVGGVTAIALGSGIVYNLLTHHLTVNVFWV